MPSANYNNNSATSGIPSQYLLKIRINDIYGASADGTPLVAYKNTGSGDAVATIVNIHSDVRKNPNHTLITCGDDWGSLGYAGSRRLKVAVVFKSFYQAGGSDDSTDTGQITVSFQMISVVSSDNALPVNDVPLAIVAIPATATTFFSVTAAEEATLRVMIANYSTTTL